MNAGAFGAIGEEEIVLHRVVDAVVFRVTPPEYDLATEAVDFNCAADIKINE
jgi:lipopolysaccharide transport system ATP-binding protein